jgi:hypothetical protein
LPENRALNTRYQNYLREQVGADRVHFAGRLANYVYIDMDDCMRDGLDMGAEALRSLERGHALRGAAPRRNPLRRGNREALA